MPPGRVLVVEDDPANQRLFSTLLRRDGYTVEGVSSGEEAMVAIARRSFDLVLLDVNLPGIDGVTLCHTLKQSDDTRLIPVVLMTGADARTFRIQGIKAGADDFLTKPINREELQARVSSLIRAKHYVDQLDSAESVIISLGRTVEARDQYTQGHCERMAVYATTFGRSLGLGQEEVAALHRGAFLHDIGKIGIPDAVLLKKGPLSDAEYALMKTHAEIGEGLCGSLQSLAMVRPIVRHHHERLDGSGYPDALQGAAVPLLAQIVSIVDTYDAITTSRPYRRAQSQEVAFSELDGEGRTGWRDAALVEAFIALGRSGALAPMAGAATA